MIFNRLVASNEHLNDDMMDNDGTKSRFNKHKRKKPDVWIQFQSLCAQGSRSKESFAHFPVTRNIFFSINTSEGGGKRRQTMYNESPSRGTGLSKSESLWAESDTDRKRSTAAVCVCKKTRSVFIIELSNLHTLRCSAHLILTKGKHCQGFFIPVRRFRRQSDFKNLQSMRQQEIKSLSIHRDKRMHLEGNIWKTTESTRTQQTPFFDHHQCLCQKNKTKRKKTKCQGIHS